MGRSSLTDRQLEVLRLISQGQTPQQAAETLGITLSGMRQHLSNAANKLYAPEGTSASGLVARARRAGYNL